jgi:hypothetical protein
MPWSKPGQDASVISCRDFTYDLLRLPSGKYVGVPQDWADDRRSLMDRVVERLWRGYVGRENG